MHRTITTSPVALLLTAGLAISGASAAYAVDEHNVSNGLTAAGAPLGLHGVDPVALIESGEQVEGLARFTAVHDGVSYYFRSEDTLAAFKAAPARYLAQNGGFCTFGVSVGKKFDGDPQYAAVVDGKLYVFLNEEIYGLFLKDRAGVIAKAEQNWPEIEHADAAKL